MSAPNDGGSAFPVPPSTMITYSDGDRELKIATPGMTLRDYFAAAALTGLLADSSGNASMIAYVDGAYKFADLMLAERAKPWSNSGLTESEELLQKTQQLENEIAALRAEKKRLVDAIRAVLCDPEGRACFAGTDADRAVIQAALDHANRGVQP